MMPNITRGSRMAGLVMYLAGPGRANEHTNPHVVAGDELVTFQVPTGQTMTNDDALDVANIMNRPQKLYGTEVTVPKTEQDPETGERVTVGRKPAGVWHCSLSLKADEGRLTDELWQNISSEFVEKMGFTNEEDPLKSSRWVAIRHGLSKGGNDHVHIAVQMVREDGTKANVHHDFSRAQKACNELEKKYGLNLVESREHGKAPAADKPAERSRAQRQGRPQSDRYELRRRMRSALATAASEGQYVQQLLDAGVRVQPYYQKGTRLHHGSGVQESTGQTVAGYRVALPPTGKGETRAFWYAPSKLDPALAWPRIQERFQGQGRAEAEHLMRSLHSRQTRQPDRGSRLGGITAEQAEKLISGKATTDTLANVYARVSMSVETKRPGVFARLADEYSRAGYSRPGVGQSLHAARIVHRAATKNSAPGWVALIQQANRIARTNLAMSQAAARAQQSPSAQRSPSAQWAPGAQWSKRVASAVSSAEQIINSHTTAAQQPQTPARAEATRPPTVTPRPRPRRTPRTPRENGYER